MLERCYFCRGKVVVKKISIDYRWGDDLMVIDDVPAGVCQQCGEKYLESETYKGLERLARTRDRRKGKLTVDVLEYGEAPAA